MLRAKGILAGVGLGVALSLNAGGAVLYVSTFDSNDEGWLDRDASEMAVSFNGSFGNGAGSLAGVFASQGIPTPETDAFRAGGSTAGGAFAGDYTAVNAGEFVFSFYAEDVLPSDLVLRLNGGSGTFFRSVGAQVSGIGSWYTVTVPLVWDASWVGSGAGAFATALTAVNWIDVQVTRNGGDGQTYYLDNFELKEASESNNGGGGDPLVPEPQLGIFALCLGALLLARRRLA
ncbi:MAG: hypothetical protein H3C50_08475 [Kiritimatiellae bacterium]|nr:hypothetical protein [Kiritimatiellia bacterium]MCO5067800.1 hypothetical protein [Kiritimatiellia bacterium]